MKQLKEVNFKLPILFIKILENKKLATIDSKTNIRLLEQVNLSLSGGLKGNISHNNYKQKAVCLSSDLKYLTALNKENREVILINLENKKIFAKFNRHQGEVSMVTIDPLNRYVFSCGDDGKVFALDIKSGKLALVLPMHKDRVNDIAFSSDGHWYISVSYDKKVIIFNLSTMKTIHKLSIHSKPVMKTIFLDKSRAISIDKDSTCIVFNVYNGETLARLDGIHDDVTSLCSTEKFLFVATRLGYVILYELNDYKMLSRQFIKINSYITKLEFNKTTNTLFLATSDGDILSYNIFLGEDELRSCLQHKEYSSIQTILNKNPLLVYTSAYIRFNHIWEETLKKAKDALEKGNQKRVNQLFNEFKQIPSKNKIIQDLIDDFKDFEIFRDVTTSKKISLAYNILNMHPEYKNTKIYRKLEAQWSKSFLDAQMVLTEPRGLDKAKDILKPYRGITEKTIAIQSLLKEHMIYNRFKKSIVKEEFKIVFEYVKLHPFLKEFPEYKNMLDYAISLHKKYNLLINRNEFTSAIRTLTTLKNFTDFKDEAQTAIDEIKINRTFFNAIKNNNLQLAYELLDKNFQLYTTKDGELLQKKWVDDVEQANSLALHANIKELNNLLNKYFDISSRYISLANIYAYCYITELERAIRSKKSRLIIEKGIKKYIAIFGLNNQIVNFYTISKKYYKDINLDLKNLPCGSLSIWKPNMIVDSIVK